MPTAIALTVHGNKLVAVPIATEKSSGQGFLKDLSMASGLIGTGLAPGLIVITTTKLPHALGTSRGGLLEGKSVEVGQGGGVFSP